MRIRLNVGSVSTWIGYVLVAVVLFVAVLAPYIAPHPDEVIEPNIMARLQAPSWTYLFGTDDLGRDVLSRVIFGTRSALTFAIGVVVASMLVGVPIGLIAGYTDGFISNIFMRLTDLFLSVPQLVLALALAQILTPGPTSAAVALTLTYWPFFARTAFSETRALRSAVFIEVLESMGSTRSRTLFLHILPNIAAAVIVRASIGLGFITLMAATLGFLGVGASPPDPDWGLSISNGRQFLPEHWWIATFPGLAILITVLGFNLLGDNLIHLINRRRERIV